MLSRLRSFLGEAWLELKRVNWPTRAETTRLTIVVMVMSVMVAALLGAFDVLFTYLFNTFIIG